MTEIETARAEDQVDVLGKTTCLLLRFHKTGLIRKGSLAKIQTQAKKERLGLNKKILVSENYENLLLVSRDCRRFAKARQVPGSPFAEGTHLIPLPLVDDINAKIANAMNGYNMWADQFVAEYENLVEEARIGLADQFSQANYFDVSTPEGRMKLRSKFWVERQWFDWSPSNQSKVSDAVANQENLRHTAEVQDMAQQIKAALRLGLKKLIDHLVERLTPGPGGKKKQFAPTTVTKVVDFLSLFSARNVVGDRELAVLADQAKLVLDGQTADSIKEDDEMLALVATRMSEVKTGLDKLVLEVPDRFIQLEDEDEEDDD